MGVYLAKPATDKISASAACSSIEYGASSMQGWRTAQEDAHCCHLEFNCTDASAFGVFDGHGGADISRFCADHFLDFLLKLDSYKEGNYEKALEEVFLLLDESLLEENVRRELLDVRARADQAKNGGARDGELDDDRSSEYSDVSGDDPDQLRAEAQMSMADLIAQFVKPKKGSPFLYKKSSVGTSKSKLASGAEVDASPVTIGRKRALCATATAGSSSVEQHATEIVSSSITFLSSETDKSASSVDQSNGSNSTPSVIQSSTSGVGSPSEPEEKRPLISEMAVDENAVESVTPVEAKSKAGGKSSENGEVHGDHCDAKCEGLLADCKKVNAASGDNGKVVQKGLMNGNDKVEEKKEREKVDVDEEKTVDNEEEAEAEKDEEDETGDENEDESEDEEEEDEEESDSDEVYREMMEEELRNAEEDEDDDDDDDLEGEEGASSRKERLKKLKAFGLLGGAALRRSILAGRGQLDDEDEDSSDEDDEDESDEAAFDEDDDEDEDDGDADGMLKVRGGPDIEFLSPPDERVPGVGSGATAIVALVKNGMLYVANAGDSRCIVYQDGKTVPMSFDHKPEDTIELERITRAGGRVTPDGRVMGGLNLSRAIGDHLYKRTPGLSLEEQMVTAKPDLNVLPLKLETQQRAQFMVLACDGIWNSMSNDEVGDFVAERIDKMPLVDICSELFDRCLAPSTAGDGTGCDNMTAIIVRFLDNKKDVAAKEVEEKQVAGKEEQVKTD